MLNDEIVFAERLGRVALTPAVKRILGHGELQYVLLRHLRAGESAFGTKSTIEALPGCRVLTAYRLQDGKNNFPLAPFGPILVINMVTVQQKAGITLDVRITTTSSLC